MSIDIMTWNVQWGKGVDEKVNLPRVIETAQTLSDFDILCLQEVSVGYPGLTLTEPADQVAQLQALLPGYQIIFGAACEEQPTGDGPAQQFGNVIASRLPVLQIQRFALPSPVDTESPVPGMSRMCLIATVTAPWGPLRVMTTHLEYHSQPQRMAQARALADWHDTESLRALHPSPAGEKNTPYQPKPDALDALLCGDFNFPPFGPEYNLLLTRGQTNPLADAWGEAHGAQAHEPTFHLYDKTWGDTPVACDFFFVSEALANRVENIRVDTQTQASDHQPVVLTLRT